MTSTLEQRVRQYRSRMLIRAWEYRQRRHARGVWFRLRRLLAGASHAYVISQQDAEQLRAEGFHAEPVGREIEPPKTIVVAPAHCLAVLTNAREVPVSLSGELLIAECLLLVPFQPDRNR